ncbi:MAG: DNA topoisomerase 4 subunit A, partial [Alphaproteobacteria bacterium]|nr:DNA topoisomerase 4 subunit A [Alphaproteobacteria bacterium]
MTKRIPLNKNKKSNGTDNVLPIEQSAQIIEEDISMQMRSSYLNYAMSVITDRALPDVRDGLKPVHRRILYAMHGMGLSSTAKTRKSAAVTGEVLGKYHPHGNIAVYDAMVKLAQDFGTRYPLVIGQGNFGSIDGDSPAAERYTEAKLSKLAESMLQDIHKKTVLFQPNYENIHEEPTVLPAVVPHLLVNGAFGIAVAMATSIPPHNLTEVCNGALHLLENPDASVSDLMKHIKAPDFPLGGLVYDVKAIKSAYTTGRGSVVMRGEVTIEDEKKNTHIIITSIPYNVNKATLIQSIGELVQEKKIDGIKDLRDESTKDIRIVIEVKSSHEPQRILHLLYKHTSLESKFNFNMVGLIEGTPRTLTLPLILTTYLNHRRGVVEKRIAFDLAEAKAREHIVSGLKKALDHIDAIITLIRGSKDVDTARAELIKKYKFSDLQTQAILDMKLQRLAGLERKKIEEELKTLHESISKFEDILKNKKKIDAEVGNEIVLLRDAFGDARRTTIVHTAPGAVSEE